VLNLQVPNSTKYKIPGTENKYILSFTNNLCGPSYHSIFWESMEPSGWSRASRQFVFIKLWRHPACVHIHVGETVLASRHKGRRTKQSELINGKPTTQSGRETCYSGRKVIHPTSHFITWAVYKDAETVQAYIHPAHSGRKESHTFTSAWKRCKIGHSRQSSKPYALLGEEEGGYFFNLRIFWLLNWIMANKK
jgi:hypothetical protein